MKRAWKITIGVVASLLIVIAVLAMVMFIPLQGSKSDYVWSYSDAFDIENIATVEKQAGKPFRILQLTDIQLWTNGKDNKRALEIAKETAAQAQPDLIAVTGDNVSSVFNTGILKDFIQTMEEIGVPWAPVFGNHDAQGRGTLEWQADRFREAEHCLFRNGPANLYGVGNYAVNITENGAVVETLFFFDNGRYDEYVKGSGNKEVYMGYEQIAWYEWNIEGIAAAQGKVVPSMTFSHFAPPEMKTAMELYGQKSAENGYLYVPEQYGFGYCQITPCVSDFNSGFFQKCKKLGSTHAMFFGHDHENTASVVYEGIRLTYGMKTGPSPKPWNPAVEYGGTLITLEDAGNIEVEHIVVERK